MSSIEYKVAGSVAVVTMDAPHRNALTDTFAIELGDHLDRAQRDRDVTCFLLCSAGKSFCSGGDLQMLTEAAADPLGSKSYETLQKIYEFFVHLQNAEIPTICAVNGAVIGAGINLALSCDLRIVSSDVRIAGFSRANVQPGGGHLSMVPHRMNLHAGAEVALFGQELDAKAAVACGFAWAQTPVEELHATAFEIAKGVGNDGDLIRTVTRSFRVASTHMLSAEAAVLSERASQLWSLRRRFHSDDK